MSHGVIKVKQWDCHITPTNIYTYLISIETGELQTILLFLHHLPKELFQVVKKLVGKTRSC